MARWQSTRLASERDAASHVAHDRAFALERGVERMLSNNYALAALVHQADGTVERFEDAAAQLLTANTHLLALSLSPGGVVQHVAPLRGNERLLGFDQLNDPAQRREALFARESARLTLTGPLPLAQGGIGLVSRLPVFLKDAAGQPKFWGFTNVTIRLSDLMGSLRFDALKEEGYAYRLWRLHPDTGQLQVIAASSATTLREPVRESLQVPNGVWNL
jgi:sensor domain CHASE-containing protein